MATSLGLIAVLLAFAAVTGTTMAYKFLSGFRFWFFDIWADLPVVGMVARRVSMRNPTSENANARLNELYRAYRLHMPRPISEIEFQRIRDYLFYAGDSRSKPTPPAAWLLLLLLICAESYAVSFILGLSLSGDMSQNRASVVAAGLAFVLGFVLLVIAHKAGHQMRRTHALREANPSAIDQRSPLPQGEKPVRDLCQLVKLDEDQSADEGLLRDYSSQRLINRVGRTENDHGSYILPLLFIAAVVMLGIGQFELRQLQAINLAGPASQSPEWANGLFVMIFFLTQGLALLFGYQYGFIGQQSADGYRTVGGRTSYSEYRNEMDPMIERANESLDSLRSKLLTNYRNVESIENLNFVGRFKREQASADSFWNDDSDHPIRAPEEPEPGENVTSISRDAS